MAVLELNGNETEDKQQGYGAWLNAYMRSLEAANEHPELNDAKHLNDVAQVKAKVIQHTNFRERSTRRSSNFYHDCRKRLPGCQIPGASLTFNFEGQRNFTKTDADKLHQFLKQEFPYIPINVSYGRTRCVVHVGIR